MAYGLQLMNAAGTVVFDSNTVVGGVSMGTYTVPSTGTTFSFSNFPGRQGRYMYAGAGGDNLSSSAADTTLGYPRFIFAGNGVFAYDVVLLIY